MVRLTDHDELSADTVRRRLAENKLKPWRQDMWCIPKVDGEYVARMEDVLDLYAEAPDPNDPSSALTRAQPNSLARSVSPLPPSRASLSAMTASIGVTAPSISSSSSTLIGPGAG